MFDPEFLEELLTFCNKNMASNIKAQYKRACSHILFSKFIDDVIDDMRRTEDYRETINGWYQENREELIGYLTNYMDVRDDIPIFELKGGPRD